jgi:hypothetical protein
MWVPPNGWFIMENRIQNGWFGGTPILGNLHISVCLIWVRVFLCIYWKYWFHIKWLHSRYQYVPYHDLYLQYSNSSQIKEENNVGKTIINYPPNHHKKVVCVPFPNGWFDDIVLPTLVAIYHNLKVQKSKVPPGLKVARSAFFSTVASTCAAYRRWPVLWWQAPNMVKSCWKSRIAKWTAWSCEIYI